ncbi:MAG: hypothetical protein KA436_12730 [Oligoflexales bacterium]|nr:hypothetical protein [Oligoflexales bacterium]
MNHPDAVLESEFDAIFKRMSLLIQRGTLPQVLLFEGYEGIGKSAFLLRLAALLSCEQSEGYTRVCGLCPSCHLIKQGRHPDLLVLETVETEKQKKTSIKVEDVASIQKHLLNPPLSSSKRMILIPDIDRMTVQAVNKLLKTMEEPPSSAIILLSSSRSSYLLDTLLSRCVRVRMSCQKEGMNSEQSLKISGLLQDILFNDDPASVSVLVEKAISSVELSVFDYVQEFERALNKWYKKNLQDPTFFRNSRHLRMQTIKKRRDLLYTLRRVAGREKVVLNSQLTLESLSLPSGGSVDLQ